MKAVRLHARGGPEQLVYEDGDRLTDLPHNRATAKYTRGARQPSA
jgi:hypothetical protein